ncbi:hypothetical protein [Burkholderia sp. BDU5]|uniref:hypothetical protein n=1 Tax=Burkholderia sp. BDU5 TaxID=1385590 RepID=UPI0007561947|nr:hypothetical protein [Burkholderia sp. BDU5]KVE34520.1 hypothetical protein WS69_16565 [Burkholderia sp. BDU5]
MTQDDQSTATDQSAATFGRRYGKLNRDIAILESIVQHAVEPLQDFATLFARIIAHYATRAEMSTEDREWDCQMVLRQTLGFV